MSIMFPCFPCRSLLSVLYRSARIPAEKRTFFPAELYFGQSSEANEYWGMDNHKKLPDTLCIPGSSLRLSCLKIRMSRG